MKVQVKDLSDHILICDANGHSITVDAKEYKEICTQVDDILYHHAWAAISERIKKSNELNKLHREAQKI